MGIWNWRPRECHMNDCTMAGTEKILTLDKTFIGICFQHRILFERDMFLLKEMSHVKTDK